MMDSYLKSNVCCLHVWKLIKRQTSVSVFVYTNNSYQMKRCAYWTCEGPIGGTSSSADWPVCCFVGAEPVSPRTCRTAGPVDCREEERWFSGSPTRWSWTERQTQTTDGFELKQMLLWPQSLATTSKWNKCPFFVFFCIWWSLKS